MKQAYICKAAEGITAEQLEKIHEFTRRKLGKDELFVFSVILCDNEVDRDGERFPIASLEKLAELYKGKTGVFDHAPKAENQAARIFDAAVEAEPGMTSAGERLHRLRAWAYMARCDKNRDLILEIDAGIKKEVSVGCAVESVLCSICGSDRRGAECAHRKGEEYGGKLCHDLLVNPTDAYEWSFVAVPAQKNAGVTKTYPMGGEATPDGVTVSGARLKRLEDLAALGKRYQCELREDVVRLGMLGSPEIPPEVLGEIADKLEPAALTALRKSFAKSARERYPIGVQLARGETATEDAGGAFSI